MKRFVWVVALLLSVVGASASQANHLGNRPSSTHPAVCGGSGCTNTLQCVKVCGGVGNAICVNGRCQPE
jgi:hypothetical protein